MFGIGAKLALSYDRGMGRQTEKRTCLPSRSHIEIIHIHVIPKRQRRH